MNTELYEKILGILQAPKNMPAWDVDAMIHDAPAEAHAIVQTAQENAPLTHRSEEETAMEMAIRRANGELLGIILKRVKFMGLLLETDPTCLVPRKETELLASTAIDALRSSGLENPLVIDMCCGAGNIACAIAHHVPTARVVACDLTESCVSLGQRNATRLGLSDRIQFFQGDLFEAVNNQGLEGQVDGIFCNPPYISSGKLSTDRASLLENEPVEAFDGGPYGLSIHQRVLSEASKYLKQGGWLAFEFGLGQERQLALLFQRLRKFYAPAELKTNAEGTPRVIISTKHTQEI